MVFAGVRMYFFMFGLGVDSFILIYVGVVWAWCEGNWFVVGS